MANGIARRSQACFTPREEDYLHPESVIGSKSGTNFGTTTLGLVVAFDRE